MTIKTFIKYINIMAFFFLNSCFAESKEDYSQTKLGTQGTNSCLHTIKSKTEPIKIGRKTFKVGEQIANGYDGLTFKLTDQKTGKSSDYTVKIIEKLNNKRPGDALIQEVRLSKDYPEFLPEIRKIEVDRIENPNLVRITKKRITDKDLYTVLKQIRQGKMNAAEAQKAYERLKLFQKNLVDRMLVKASKNSFIFDINGSNLRYDGENWILNGARHLNSRRELSTEIIEYLDLIEPSKGFMERLASSSPLSRADLNQLIKIQLIKDEMKFEDLLAALKQL